MCFVSLHQPVGVFVPATPVPPFCPLSPPVLAGLFPHSALLHSLPDRVTNNFTSFVSFALLETLPSLYLNDKQAIQLEYGLLRSHMERLLIKWLFHL